MGAFRPDISWVAVVVAATAACLPKGPPPAGVQVIADRQAAMGTLVPPNGDGMLRILLLRPGATSNALDLSVVSLDRDNQPSPEVPLISGVDAIYGVGCRTYGLQPCGVDATGTVSVLKADGSWTNVNAITGEFDPEPPNPAGALPWNKTPGGRSFEPGMGMTGTLIDADGQRTAITLLSTSGFGNSYQFVGEDFYYLDPQQNLIDIPPSGIPQQRATAVLQFNGSPTPDGPVLLLTRLTSSSVLDVNSGTETMLPFDGSRADLSPDGRWVLDTEGLNTGTFTFFDDRSGTEQVVQIDSQGGGFPTWRPGTAEIWLTAFEGQDMHSVWIVRPDAPAVSLPGAYMENVNMGEGPNQPFTDDGKYWFFTMTSLDSATDVVQVARTDDPTGPAFALNPPSTFLDHVTPLSDGRLLTSNYAKQEDRSDVSIVDPRTGDTNVIARRGLLVTSGQARVMGLFHIGEGRGDLTTIDLNTGEPTVLAREFTVTAAAEPQGTDALAPGTRIVYQFQARTASPYDGIWVATAP